MGIPLPTPLRSVGSHFAKLLLCRSIPAGVRKEGAGPSSDKGGAACKQFGDYLLLALNAGSKMHGDVRALRMSPCH